MRVSIGKQSTMHESVHLWNPTSRYTEVAARGVAHGVVTVAAAMALMTSLAHADEGGVSFWFPGQMASLAATPGEPGWSVPFIYYHMAADAGASRDFQIGGNLVAGIEVQADLLLLAPTYTWANPVLGGQAAFILSWCPGIVEVGASAVITGPGGNPVNLARTDTVEGGSDLYPMFTLKWNNGNSNWLGYLAGDIPVGAYELGRLANIGINHYAIDAGAGYTYLHPEKGHEFTIVGGVTYNWENEDTNYQNGVDGHIDWALSQFLSEQLHVGLVGYVYYQLSGDSGEGAVLGDNLARVYSVGPQAGYLFPFGGKQGYVNLRGYKEFDAERRPEGWNLWLTFSLPF